jgi:17beta-estradiol 17-dehydrogenase / very-long-chain 3-oxoacyl-CoA reductase
LAKKGMSLVLISRTEAKLQAVKEEIDAKGYNVEVKYIVCDYGTNFDQTMQTKIKKELDPLEIGVLINNVGISYRYPRYFHELPDDEVKALLTLNIDSTVWMTRMVLPGMIERKKGGAIVNMSSGSALLTMPLLAEYGAAKSFIEKFSRAINAEYRDRKNGGITCQCQAPFYVSTKMARMRPSLSVPSAMAFANMGVNWIGYADTAVVQPHWVHGIMSYVAQHVVPENVVANTIGSMHKAIRKKGLKKDAKLAQEAANKSK